MKDKMETKKCYLIQEWLGDSYKICGVYDTVEDFIPEMKKYIERDGSLKIIRHKYVDKDQADTLRKRYLTVINKKLNL